MKKIVTQTWCDYPGCADMAQADGATGQDTGLINFWVYAHGRGRKTVPILVDVCEQHREELRNLFLSLQKYDQKVSE